MNLTQQQVNSLARMMRDEHDDSQEVKFKAAEPTPAQLKKAREVAKGHHTYISKLPDYIRKNIKPGYNENLTLRNLENWTINHLHPKYKKVAFNFEKACDKVVVTAMSCKTVQEIKTKLKIKE